MEGASYLLSLTGSKCFSQTYLFSWICAVQYNPVSTLNMQQKALLWHINMNILDQALF